MSLSATQRAAAAILATAALLTMPAGASAASCTGTHWVGAWATSPSDGTGKGYRDQTLRLIVRPTLSGRRLRVRLSNRFGEQPVTFASAVVARRGAGGAEVAGGATRLRFGGRTSVTLRPGREITSDAAALRITRFRDLAVSLHVRGASGPSSRHASAYETSYASAAGSGDHTSDTSGAAFTEQFSSWPYISGVDVRASKRVGAVAAVGDSITDGASSTLSGNSRWPDILARRLATAGRDIGVLNAGITGNRVRGRGALAAFGPSLLERLDNDVLRLPGVTDAIILEGTNDLGAAPVSSAKSVIDGLRTIVRRLRAGRLRPILATQTPVTGYAGGVHGSPAAIAKRNRINRWIRDSGIPYVDFHAAVRDPADPDRLRAAYDSGDHLHLNDAGYRAMGRAVRLSLLSRPCR